MVLVVNDDDLGDDKVGRGMTVTVDIITSSLLDDFVKDDWDRRAGDGTVESGITVAVDITTTSLLDVDFDVDVGGGGAGKGTTVIALVTTTKD